MKKCPYCAEEIQDEALKCKHCGSWVESPPGQPPPTMWGQGSSVKGMFRRSSRSRMLTGVCGGIAEYLGGDPVLIRVIYALGTVFTGIIPGIVTYIILSFIVPVDDSNLV